MGTDNESRESVETQSRIESNRIYRYCPVQPKTTRIATTRSCCPSCWFVHVIRSAFAALLNALCYIYAFFMQHTKHLEFKL
jgi:hypothetical protein